MASLDSAPPWNAEDDLLLKNAVEAGASLEALAKGAVQFSRRFTMQELQDRWHSLLCDADVSSQASAKMTEFEIANPSVIFKATKFGVSKSGGKSSPVKRKGESVRRLYHDMRKRLCSFNTFDLSFIDEPISHDENNMGNELLDGNFMVGDHVEDYLEFSGGGQNAVDRGALTIGKSVDNKSNDPCPSVGELVNDNSKCTIVDRISGDDLVEFQNCPSSEVLGTSQALQEMPLWKTMEDISAPEMPINVGIDDKGRNSEAALIHGDKEENKISFPPYRSLLVGDEFNDISDSLLNFAHENEHLAMDVDSENLNDKSCIVCDKPTQSSLLTSGHEIDAEKVLKPETLDSNNLHSVSEDVNNTVKNDNTNTLHSTDENPDVVPKVDTPPIKTPSDPRSPEFRCEMMECTLNTEDPEIPCNDEPGVTESSAVDFHLINQKNVEQESFRSKKGDNPVVSMASQMVGHGTIPKTNPSLPVNGCLVKPEPSDVNCPAPSSCQAHKLLTDGSQFRSAVSHKFSANHGSKQEGINAPPPATMPTANAIIIREPSAIDAEHVENATNPSPLYKDESEEEVDREIDIPYFSDIENMILEMDLSPDDEESRFKQKVARYQQDDAKRKIVRLEQCARSSTQRAIASKGALAVLYGRHLKQYIKKTEVVLGRATEDNEVDIDLGEEGRANKISRRQAHIKLEGDGSFFLKNVGKSSIFLNGKEVATGHRVCLGSSNLIEITGLSFVFEMNHKSIRRFLENSGQNCKGKYAKLDWSPSKGK